mgnify:CR=1 FL=1
MSGFWRHSARRVGVAAGCTAALCHSWRSDVRGASAVEFALIAPVVMMLLAGVLELAWMLATDAAQDAAAMRLARDLRVGFVDDVRLTESQARIRVCQVSVLLPCDALQLSAIARDSLSSADLQPPSLTASGELATTSFTSGRRNQFLIVTVHRAHRFVTPLIGWLLGDRRLSSPFTLPRTSRAVILTEPFDE